VWRVVGGVQEGDRKNKKIKENFFYPPKKGEGGIKFLMGSSSLIQEL